MAVVFAKLRDGEYFGPNSSSLLISPPSYNCRRRHVKCNENKPSCGGCAKIGQECVYPPVRQARQSDIRSSVGARHSGAINNGSGTENSRGSGNSKLDENEKLDAQQPPQSNDDGNAPVPWSPSPGPQNAPFQRPTSVPAPNSVHPHNRNSNDASMSDLHIPQHLNSQKQDMQDASAHVNMTAQDGATSTTSSTANVENATAIWVDLLLKDAAAHSFDLGDFGLESDVFNLLSTPLMAQSPIGSPPAPDNPRANSFDRETSLTSNIYLLERVPSLSHHQRLEKQVWHSEMPLRISPHDHIIFRNFVRNTSLWMDLFDPKRPFSSHVPHLAVCCTGL